MPKRKRTYYGKRKRSRKKRRKKRKYRPLPLGMFPQKQLVRFKYCTTITIDPYNDSNIPGATWSHSFRANDMFDPDYYLGGHQPMQFDQAMAHYQHFRVVGGQCKVTAAPKTNATSNTCMWGINLSTIPGESNDVSMQTMMERKTTHKWAVSGTAYARPFKTQTKKFSLKRYFGKQNISDDRFRGNALGNNVLDLLLYQIWACPVSENSPGAQHFIVEIDYYAVLFNPKSIGGS